MIIRFDLEATLYKRTTLIVLSATVVLYLMSLSAEAAGIKALIELLTTAATEASKSGARQTNKGAKATINGSRVGNQKTRTNFPISSLFHISNSSARAMRQYLDKNCGEEGHPSCSTASELARYSNEEIIHDDVSGYSISRDNNREFCAASKSFNKTQSMSFGSSRTGNNEPTTFISFSDLNWKLKGRKSFQASITIDEIKVSEGAFSASDDGKAITRQIDDNRHFLISAKKGRVVRLLNGKKEIVLGFKLTGSSAALMALNECMKIFTFVQRNPFDKAVSNSSD